MGKLKLKLIIFILLSSHILHRKNIISFNIFLFPSIYKILTDGILFLLLIVKITSSSLLIFHFVSGIPFIFEMHTFFYWHILLIIFKKINFILKNIFNEN